MKMRSKSETRRLAKTTQLRNLMQVSELTFLMEAHSGLSARIAEEAGFMGIWALGLSISAAMGVPDRNEASWTQVLDVVEFMSDATSVPLLVDGDAGFGDHNNTRRLAVKLYERGIAAVCIEDKLFAKQNSFLGNGQCLVDAVAFCDKIHASKDALADSDFCFVARTETLVASRSIGEALDRAGGYHEAGADAVLIHSKNTTVDEIVEFARQWRQRCPVVIVPTKYHKTSTDVYRQAKISTIIWANHSLRASILAMQETVRRMQREQSIRSLDGDIATLEEVFRTSGNDEPVKRISALGSAVGQFVMPVGGPT